MKKSVLINIVVALVVIFTSVIGQNVITKADQFNLSLKPGCNEIVLSWDKIPGAKYYWPYQIFEDGSEYPLIDFASKDLTFTHKDLEDGKEYCYIVKATDDKGKEITISSKVCAKTDCSKVDENCTYRMEFVVGSKSYYLDGSSYDQNGSMLTMDSPPVIVNNRTMIPAKYVVDNLKDATIQWDQKTKEVKIIAKRCCSLDKIKPSTLIDVVIIYKIGKNTVNVDGTEQPIDKTNSKIAPMIIGGRTMIPFRNLGENLGAKVDYIPSDKRIILDFDCKSKKTPNDIIDKPPNPVIKTLCGCIDSIIVAAAKGPGVPATVTFLPDCNMSANPITLKVNSYLSASNSSDPLYNYSDVLDPSSNPSTGFARPTDGWDMPSYVGSWKGQIKPGTTNDRTWCATIKYYTFGGQNYIVSWEMHPEKEECCTNIVCACIHGYDEDTAPGHIRLFIQDDCLDQPPKLHVFSVPFNKSCTNPPAGSNSYLVYNYIGDYPNGTTTGTVNGVTKKKWCIKYKTNSAGDFLSWEMTPDNCECSCIDTCKGCLVSLTPTPSCNGNIIPQNQWTAVFDFDCNPSTTNDRTTYSQSSVASSTTAGAVYVSLANLWRRCNCGQSTNSKTFTTDSDFNSGIMQSVDHNPTADQLEIQYPVTTTPFPHIWIPNWNDYTVSKVSTVSPYPVLARYRVSSKTVNTNSSLGPSRTTVDKEGNCWVAIRDTGSVVKILNIPVDNNNDGLVTSQNETDLKSWGQDDAIQYEVILDHANQGVYKPTISGQNFTGTYTTVSGPRALAIDENNTLWIGTRDTRKVYKISQNLTNNPPSATLNTYFNIANATYVAGQNCQPYGAVVDKCGSLWITSNNGIVLKLANASTSATANPVFITGNENFKPYSLTLDPNSDYLYLSSFSSNEYIYTIPTAVNANGSSWNSQTTIKYSLVSNNSGGIVRGVAFDRFGHLWSVNSNGNIRRFSCSNGFATLQSTGVNYSIPIGWSQPSGISMDTDGKMWVGFISNTSGTVFFTPNGGSSACNLTRVDVMGGHYTYSDMTGSIVNSITAPTGHWTTPVIDAGCDNPTWSQLQYQSTTPGNSSLEFYCSSSLTGIPGSWSTYALMTTPLIPPAGKRYIKIQILFRSGINNCRHISPVLKDLTVNWSCQTSVNCCADLCLDGAGKIVSITPRVEQEPCCVSNCQWTSCGVVQDVTFSQDHNTAFITVKDCSTGAINHYSGDVNLYANNASQITWATPTLVKYGVGNCAKYCIKANNTIPPEYTITEWIGISPTDPCCCSSNRCEWTGYVKVQSVTAGQNNQAFITAADCITGQILHLVGDVNLYANNATNVNWATPTLVKYEAGFCAKYCVTVEPATALLHIQEWIAVSPEDPNCCPTTPSECCEEMKLEIPLTDPENVLGYQNVTPVNCVNPGTRVKFSRMVVRNNCNYPICIKITGSIFVTDFFVAKDYSDYQNNIPITQPITIPANSSLQYLYGHFTIPECSSTKKTVFSVKQVDCTTGQDIPECIFKVYVNCCLSPECPDCPNNIVKNWGFTEGLVPGAMPTGQVSDWSPAYGSPDVGNDGGCCDPGRINMWGNKAVGEAIQQSVNFVAGKKYKVTFYGRRQPDWGTQTNAGDPPKFAFRASNSQLSSPTDTNGVFIGTSDQVTTATCTLMELAEWTAPANYSTLTVSVTNDISINDGEKVSKGLIDRICITEISTDCCREIDVIIPNTEPANSLTYGSVVATECAIPGSKIKFSRMEIKNNCNYPVCISFDIYPSNNGVTDLFIAKDFSDYQNGIAITQPVTIPAMGTLKYLYGHFTVPASFTGNSNGQTVFRVISSNCTTGEFCRGIKVGVKTCEPCCDFMARTKPEVKLRPLELCPNESATIDYWELFNNCPVGSQPITIQSITPVTAGISFIQPATPFSLAAQERKSITFKLTMPGSCTTGSSVAFKFVVKTNCGQKEFTVTAKCKDCTPCCDWDFKQRTDKKYGKLYLCSGEIATVDMYEIVNNCPTSSTAIQYSISIPKSSNIQSISPSNFTLNPGERKTLLISIKMPDCNVDTNVGIDFSFNVSTTPNECSKSVKFTVYCKDCTTCCDWVLDQIVVPKQMCYNEEFKFMAKITNKCSKAMKFTITPGQNTTINGSTGSFTSPIAIPANGTLSFTVVYKMPKCTPPQKVSFTWTVKPENCEEKTITSTTECKSCDQCCQWDFVGTESSINMSNAELCAGEKLWIKIKVKNLCPNDKVIINFSPDDPTSTIITPASLEIQPGQIAEYKIEFTMPKCSVGGSVKLSYRYKACGKDTGQNWSVKCKDCWCGKKSSIIKLTKIDTKVNSLEGTWKSGSTALTMKFTIDGTEKKWSLLEIGKCYEICYEVRSTRAGEYFYALDFREVNCPQSVAGSGKTNSFNISQVCN